MPYERNDELPAAVRKKYTAKQQRAFRKAYNDAARRKEPEARRFQIAHAAARRADQAELDVARTFSAEQRRKLAREGKALPDGSFPIVTKQDLRNAIQAYGRASNKSRAKAHIIKRARALGATGMLPEDWASSGGLNMETAKRDKKKGYRKKDSGSLLECTHEGCERTFGTEEAAEDHALAVHSHDEIRQAISKALRAKFIGPPRRWAWVAETADDWFVYALEDPGAVDEKLYRQGYTFSDGEATLTGEPVEVRRRTVYDPVTKGD